MWDLYCDKPAPVGRLRLLPSDSSSSEEIWLATNKHNSVFKGSLLLRLVCYLPDRHVTCIPHTYLLLCRAGRLPPLISLRSILFSRFQLVSLHGPNELFIQCHMRFAGVTSYLSNTTCRGSVTPIHAWIPGSGESNKSLQCTFKINN